MESALPLVREKLKDIKPPISDDAIRDSLWHYWFDVDKTVTWLRKEWEKKGKFIPPPPSPILSECAQASNLGHPAERTPGDAGPPKELLPTPEQEPRPRPRRRRNAAVKPASQPQPSAPSPQPPLTALQRLSLARKQAAAGSASASASATPASSAASSAPATRGSTPALDALAKPMSKLALLAQKRREAAAAKEASSSSASTTVSTPVPSPVPPAEQAEAAPVPAKPLSKLAQKMAAARAARAEAASRGPSDGSPAPTTPVPEAAVEPDEPETEMSALFSVVLPVKKSSSAPSTFFSMLTKPPVELPPEKQPSLAHMHIAVRGDLAAAEQRVREAFGPGVESPDDIILRKQDGRVATGGGAHSVEPPKVVREVRVEKPAQEKPVQSEVAAAQSQQAKEQSMAPAAGPKGLDNKLRRHRSPTKKSDSGPKKTNAASKPPAKDKPAGGAKKSDPSRQALPQKAASNRPSKSTPSAAPAKGKTNGKPKPTTSSGP